MKRVFVYGTLMQGMDNYHLIQPFVSSITPAVINGAEIYHLDYGYPAVILNDGETQVHGEIVELNHIEKAMPVLDHLEDYHGPGCDDNLYDRVVCKAINDHGEFVEVFVYQWANPQLLDKIGHRVSGGSWRNYMSEQANDR